MAQPNELAQQNLTNADFASISSWDDALELINEKLGGEMVSSADLGDGFTILEDKQQLIGIPLVVLSVRTGEGDFGPFLSLRVVTKDGRKLILNDGSTGIRDQIVTLYEQRPNAAGKPILCTKGLRKSDYTYTDAKGEKRPATTFYLDTSAS